MPEPSKEAADDPLDEIHPPEARDPDGLFISKPQSVLVQCGYHWVTLGAIAGQDVQVVARVDGSQLPSKPSIKWFKGKWLELGSKSGARFQFKESLDKESKEHTFELLISKVVLGDRGDYRCEVTAKDKKDSCSFNIDVEATRPSDEDNVLQAFKRTGDAKDDTAGELDFSGLLKKREVQVEEKKKKKDDDDGFPPEIWELLKGVTKKSEYERIAFQYGITDLRGMLKRLKKVTAEPKKSEAFVRKLDPAYQVDKGKKIRLMVELSNPDLPLKWYKNGQLIKPSNKYVFENVGLKRILTIHKCSLADDAAYECRVNDEMCVTEVFVKEPPVTISKGLDDQQVVVGERVVLEAEVSEEGAHVIWLKDGVELTREETFKYRFKKDGRKHFLIINEAVKEDAGHYKIMTNGGESEADVIVDEKQLEVLQAMADLTVQASDQAVFKCEVSDEKVTGRWFKNGVEVKPSKRIHITHSGRIHKLVIDDVRPEDEGDYTFVPDGFALSLSAKLNFLEIKVEYVPKQEPPKIHLDTSKGASAESTVVVVAGNKLRLEVPISGEPAPVVTWSKGEEAFTAREGRVHLEDRPGLCSFVIESAERADEAKYGIRVSNPAGEDTATIIVRVVDVPDPPENVRVTAVGEDWASLSWDPPKYDGGQPVTGYLLERKKQGSQRWVKLNFEPLPGTTFESQRMLEGVLYEMRVLAVNAIGVSPPSMNTRPFMPIAPTSEPTHLVVDDVTDTTATLKWRPPEHVGAGGIDGYIVEYQRQGEDHWTPAHEGLVPRCSLTAKGLPTGEQLQFRVFSVNIAGRSPPAVGQHVTIREIVERPKIRLPRHLRQTYVRKVGEQVNLVIPFQGKPRPQVTWSREGQPLGSSVNVRTSTFDAVFFIRAAAREDSGTYRMVLRVEALEDAAELRLRIVDRPGPPCNVRVTEVWGFNAALEWEPPTDDGNAEVTGYTVQKADTRTMEWFTVYEHNRQPRCTVSELVMGNEYVFRVYSENQCGLSENAALSSNSARIPKAVLNLKPPQFKEHDFRSAPLFLTPLVDRSAVAGYSTALYCAVRGHPKPKVEWLKNQMVLGPDPRFLARHSQGVLTLLIRKPGPFDGGVYGCRAVNELGEALTECRLEIRDTR
ncbi:myosin-binding protein C, fast-type [Melopsittacus undulatus]|uniref:myosin-binding protein C, fast-type n=1 Tax=Melopsittacus undulatus TaxID=13146 RepID=UPI00146B13C8|nr:myosin-binding protein C, fast-type [Melopsittacus undulatus]